MLPVLADHLSVIIYVWHLKELEVALKTVILFYSSRDIVREQCRYCRTLHMGYQDQLFDFESSQPSRRHEL